MLICKTNIINKINIGRHNRKQTQLYVHNIRWNDPQTKHNKRDKQNKQQL